MKIDSKTIILRLVDVEDAFFIKNLRADKKLNRFISRNDDTLDSQIKWIQDYKQREKRKEEYYFIICRKVDNVPIGTARIYDFIKAENSFCFGSWMLNVDKTRYAALESFMCIFDFAFLELGFKRCHVHFKNENQKVIDFHVKVGMKIINTDHEFLYGHIHENDYFNNRQNLINVINCEKND
jgi:RimJ/RimL family protein N-acetyltransferase